MGTRRDYKRTITPELLEAWQTCRRPTDSAAIAEKYGFSRPIVDRALNIGYCAKNEIKQCITEFFVSRQEEEKKEALMLNAGAGKILETANTLEDGNQN